MSDLPSKRWQSRPVGASAVRAAIFAIPIVAAIVASLTIVREIPRHPGTANLVLRWGVALIVSTIVIHLADRLVRRFLPLAALLQLSLVFPNEAPSRFRLARRAASTKDLSKIVERAREGKIASEPAIAAVEILALVAAVEGHDRGTRGHSERVRIFADMLADQMRLPKRDRDRLRWAALLHDVGKLIVPNELLNKPGDPDEDEWTLIHRHPAEGARLTQTLRPWLGEWADAIAQHHERWDGAGYPRGLRGEQISLGARIVAVADSFETMTARRPYRKPMRAAHARAELVRCSGTQFDPAVVRAFLHISVRRLDRVGGPVSWIAQTPLIRGVEQAATSGAAAVGGTALALGIAPAPIAPAAPPDPKPVVRTADTPAGKHSPSRTATRAPGTKAPGSPGTSTPGSSPSASASSTPSPTTPPAEEIPPAPTTEPSSFRTPLPSAIPSREP